MLSDNSQGNPQQIDPRMLLQMMMARRAQGGAIPGAAAPQTQAPSQGQSQTQPQQGGMPGAASAPQAQSQGQPSQGGPARQLPPMTQTPFSGTFGDRKGVISQLINAAEKKSYDKKANEAAMYYSQINSFLASGKPEDQQHAQQLLDDPKVRKALLAAYNYKPLEEEPPPEAVGVSKAQQQISQKASTLQKLQTMLTGGQKQGNAQPRPPGRAIIPGPSQASQQAYQLGQAKTNEAQASAQKDIQEGNRADAEALADKQKADAETVKAEAEKAHWQSESDKTKADLELTQKKLKDLDNPSSQEYRTNEAKINVLKSQKLENDSHSRLYDRMGNKVPGSILKTQIDSARKGLFSAWQDAKTINNKIAEDMQKQTGMSKKTGAYFGFGVDPSVGSFKASTNEKQLREALKWWDSEGLSKISDGSMTPSQALTMAYKKAGIDVQPSPGDSSSGSVTVDTPSGLMTFPDQDSADQFKAAAGIQ